MRRDSFRLLIVFHVLVTGCSVEHRAAPPPRHASRTTASHDTRRVQPASRTEEEAKADPVVEGDGLSSSQITPVVQQRFPAMRGCHTMQYGGGQAMGGTMTVHLQINADGTVESADVEDSTFGSPSLDECVIGVAKGIRFPAAAAATDFSWRFKFRAPADSRRSSR